MVSLLLILSFFQNHYYQDGIEVRMRNGTTYKTASEITEDKFFYTWKEDGLTISLEKSRVVYFNYFSMKVQGRPPQKKVKTSVQRRLTGESVAYLRDGQTHLRVRHVNLVGKSAEGGGAPCYVGNLAFAEKSDKGNLLRVTYKVQSSDPVTSTFTFYNLRGYPICKVNLDVPPRPKKKKKKKKDQITWYDLQLPKEVMAKDIGLVEVVSIK